MKVDVKKIILVVLLFLVASFFTFEGFYFLVPIITHYGRRVELLLPTILTMGAPLFSLICLLIYDHCYDVRKKWHALHAFVAGDFIVMTISLIWHVFLISTYFDWQKLYGIISPLFPYDILVMQIVMLAIGGIALKTLISTKDYLKVPLTSEAPFKKGHFIKMIILVSLGAYFTGDLFSARYIIESTIDPNWPLMIPFFLSFLLIDMMLVLYGIYIYQPEEKKQKFFLKAIFIALVVTIAVSLYQMIALIINPRVMYESLDNFYALGFCAKFPFGALIVLLVSIICIVSAIRNYYLKYLKKNEQK